MRTVSAPSVPLGTEAILSNARLEASDIDAPMAMPVDAPLAQQDSYEAHAAASDTPSASELDEARDQANPFDGLERGDAEDVRLSDRAQGLEHTVDATASQLGRLNAALLALARAGKEIPAQVLEGFTMASYDAQAQAKPLPAAQLKDFEIYTAKLAANEATEADHKQFWAQMNVGEQDVMSFVERVLREAYVIQNGTLLDMANQLKKTNDLRKRIQEELARARKTSGVWASESKGSDTWMSSEPYATFTVNEGAGALEPDLVAAGEQPQSDDGSGATVDTSPSHVAQMFAALDATGSSLGTQQRIQMRDLTSDDAIKANLPAILSAIPNMSAAELKFYVEGYLRTLHRAGDDDTILKIFGAMGPAQQLQVISDGFPQGYFNFGQKDAEKFRDATVIPIMNAFGSDFDIQPYLRLNHHGATYELTQFTASQLLQQLRSKGAPEPGSGVDATNSSGDANSRDQRTIDTNKEMDDYIQTLEDNVNSLGDDAQIQQIDLQDALQKNQQTMQMLSNLMKVLHDTAMAVIRNDNS